MLLELKDSRICDIKKYVLLYYSLNVNISVLYTFYTRYYSYTKIALFDTKIRFCDLITTNNAFCIFYTKINHPSFGFNNTLFNLLIISEPTLYLPYKCKNY